MTSEPNPRIAWHKDLDRAELAILIGGGLVVLALTVAFFIWAVVQGWPLILLVLGLGITTVFAKGRRKKFGVATLSAFLVMCVVAVVQGPAERQSSTVAGELANRSLPAPGNLAPAPLPPPAPAWTLTPAPAAPPAAPVDPTVTVTQVIDGDTFVVVGGAQVRVLAIDSCEMTTDAGPQAKAAAESWISSASNQVRLVQQPGAPDRDRYGRLLRYVLVPNSSYPGGYMDLGSVMVQHPHTGVYQGRNDAAPSYVDELRKRDLDGRICATPAPPPVVVNHSEDNDHTYVPVPHTRKKGGESRFCAKRRWC